MGREGLGGVCDGVGRGSGGGYALGQVGLDYGVEAIGGLVVELEVLVDAIPEDEGGDSGDVESSVVGLEEELGVCVGVVGAETREKRFNGGDGLFFRRRGPMRYQPLAGWAPVSEMRTASMEGMSAGVLLRVGVGADEALLFAAEEDESAWCGGGGRPRAWTARATSRTVATPVPLSCAPVAGCHESRWAPTMTISFGEIAARNLGDYVLNFGGGGGCGF